MAQFFYPAYVFGGVAVLSSAVVGLAGRLIVEGGRSVLSPNKEKEESRTEVDRKGKKKMK